jgi:cell division septum initiation protein DivIVA
VTIEESAYANLVQENTDLKNQVAQLAEQLNISYDKLEELTKMIESDELSKKKELEDMKSMSKL